jgi:hypothetical protein
LKQYATEVKQQKFPESGTHTYKMADGEQEKLQKWIAESNAATGTE